MQLRQKYALILLHVRYICFINILIKIIFFKLYENTFFPVSSLQYNYSKVIFMYLRNADLLTWNPLFL